MTVETGTITVTQTRTVTAGAASYPTSAQSSASGEPYSPPSYDGHAYFDSSSPPQPGFPFDPHVAPHQVPPPMFLPPVSSAEYQTGAIMDPFTAVLSIVTVAAMYWGLKSGGVNEMLAKWRDGVSTNPRT